MEEDRCSSEEEEEEPTLLLGYVQPADAGSSRLQRQHFPSKAWLHPHHLPPPERLRCELSAAPLKFLLQVYAPDDATPAAFHRTLFLFVSPQGGRVHESGTVRAFRCQLARANPFYAFDPPAAGESFPADANPGWLDANPFPESELVIEDEPDSDAEHGDTAMAAAAPQQAPAGDEVEEEQLEEDELADFEDTADQAHFSLFSARVSRSPSQCLRYSFVEGAEPLWPSRHPVPSTAGIPPCHRCGSARRFEFQVMPQLLNYLGQDVENEHALDFGTVAVYSCAASCSLQPGSPECPYAEEFVWVQRSDLT